MHFVSVYFGVNLSAELKCSITFLYHVHIARVFCVSLNYFENIC